MQKNKFLKLVVILLLFLLISCAPSVKKVESQLSIPPKEPEKTFQSSLGSPASELLKINSLLIVSPQYDRNVSGVEALRSDAYERLTEAFKRELEMQILANEEILKESSAMTQDTQRAQFAGRKGADSFLVINIHNFVERSSSRQAKVSFSASIKRVDDVREVWRGYYAVGDKDVTENLLEARQSFDEKKMANAMVMLSKGFNDGARDFALQRLEKFSGGKL